MRVCACVYICPMDDASMSVCRLCVSSNVCRCAWMRVCIPLRSCSKVSAVCTMLIPWFVASVVTMLLKLCAAAPAYEVLSDPTARAEYDARGGDDAPPDSLHRPYGDFASAFRAHGYGVEDTTSACALLRCGACVDRRRRAVRGSKLGCRGPARHRAGGRAAFLSTDPAAGAVAARGGVPHASVGGGMSAWYYACVTLRRACGRRLCWKRASAQCVRAMRRRRPLTPLPRRRRRGGSASGAPRPLSAPRCSNGSRRSRRRRRRQTCPPTCRRLHWAPRARGARRRGRRMS
jgi:hypothetical protein